MAGYDFAAIEAKWQRVWDERGTFRQPNPGQDGFQDRPKFYVLDMFPYPSAAGLHVGHPEGYTATDIVARYRRMRGWNVLHPMGYDAFGLPAEQYAIDHGVHPRETAEANIAGIERQIRRFGFSYDWSRRVATTDPDYYQWTQWIFLQMFNAWYDSAADAARPIGELIDRLEAGTLVVDLAGNVTAPPISESIEAIGGVPGGFYKFPELDPHQQRQVIDAQRLAYQAEVPVNWCPRLGTVLANEEVTNDGRSERGNHPVYRRVLRQWMLRITAYADRLLNDIEPLDWPESIKIMQRNWIGRSEGADVRFSVVDHGEDIVVYTTRPDTLFGATYMVLAPEHPLVEQITTDEHRAAVRDYVAQAARKSELERTAETKEKTGVFTGAHAVNPVNDEQIPIWIADYVMLHYGTGAIMAVPAHDERDLEFAEAFDLPVVQVVEPPAGEDWRGYTGEGTAVNSGEFAGLPTAEFKKRITEWLEERGLGEAAVNYKLRDWLFSRQRYWGEPFPLVHCEQCGTVGLPESELPLTLPETTDFRPQTSDDATAPPTPPLGQLGDWVNTTCPRCGGPARRETNVMPQWAGSCWYYLRYLDPTNATRFCDPAAEQYWMGSSAQTHENAERRTESEIPNPKSEMVGGVDLYVGGAEHAVLHLLYARFWHKVLHDLGHVSTPEPFAKLFNQGMIQSYAFKDGRGITVGPDDYELREADGEPAAVHKTTGETLQRVVAKMSKSLKNVINPDDVIAEYGADTFRLYEMFMGPLEAAKPWNTQDVPGVHRFLNRVWRMVAGDEGQPPLVAEGEGEADADLEQALHRLIKKVGADIEAMKFNTAIAAMMEFVNAANKAGRLTPHQARRFVLLLAPFAPHIAEELWQRLGHAESLAHEPWPDYDEARIAAEQVELAVQVNGKVRARVSVPADADEAAVLETALSEPKVADAVAGKDIVKKIVVPGRLVNLVVK